MKRQETILVYSLTGLLVVILLVAVVFGNEGEVAAGENRDVATNVTDGGEAAALADFMLVDSTPSSGELEGWEVVAEVAEVAETVETDPVVEVVADVPDRAGDYREVTVQRGDTFSLIVQRECGSLDKMPAVEALNEDVEKDSLRPGRVLLVPWVAQNVLDEAAKNRLAAPVSLDVAEPEVVDGRLYAIQEGDSLWKIAVQETGGQRSAPAYVKRIQEMNPGLDPDRLFVGKSILLPKP